MLDEIVGLLKSGSAIDAAKNIAALASARMRTPMDGQPHKPDDLTLIVFSRRKGRGRTRRPKKVIAEESSN
jgi:hypothetical protein